jgi:PAS domain S-box-containing protein
MVFKGAAKIRGLSIKWKISIIAAFASGVALVLSFGFLLVYDLAMFEKSIEQDLNSLAQVIGSNSAGALADKDTGRAAKLLQALRSRKEIVAAGVYGEDGELLGRYLRGDVYAATVPAKPARIGAAMQHGAFETTQLIREGGRNLGYVFLSSDTSAWADRLKRYGWTAITVLLASLAMATLVAWLLHRTISDPIYSLLHTMRRVTAMQNYSLRADKPSDDEIGSVVDGFNQMLAEIQVRDEALRLANEDLEDRVRERTGELETQISDRRKAEAVLEVRNQELLTLHRISQIDLSTQSLSSAFENIVQEISNATGFPMVTIEVFDKERNLMLLHAAHGLDRARALPTETDAFMTVSGTVARTGTPIVRLPDHNGIDYSGEILLGAGVQTYVCMPMTGQEGIAGALSLATYDQMEPNPEFLRWLESLANYLAFLLERQSSDERLRLSEERTRKIIETALDAVVSVDGAGRITGWNPQAETIFGWRADEVVGTPVADAIIPPAFREAHIQGMQRFRETGEGRVVGQRIEITAMHRSGREFPVEIAISPINASAGVTFTAFIRDITARKEAEADLARARDAALAAARLKSEFLANMSHEIRTPMNGVIGMADLLMDTPLSDEQHDYAATIRSSANALLTVINDILDFSKIEAGRMVIDITDVDIREILEEVAELLAPVAQNKGVELMCSVAADVPRSVRTDPVRVRQMANNLLGNAVKFTEQGEIVLGCEVIESDGDQVLLRISVSDTGIGIPAENLRTIFESFTQVDGSTTRRFGGTGLGLTICRQLAQLLGGEIGVESKVGSGSTFWVEVPVEVAANSDAKQSAESVSGLRVLIVDDNATNRRILEQQLTSWGCLPECADSGQSALDLLNRKPRGWFGLAILDMQMPEMDGFHLARAIIRESNRWAPKLILLSSTGQQWSEAELSAAGFFASLSKPARQSQIYDTILEALGDVALPMAVSQKPVIEATGEPLRILLAEDNAVNRKVATKLLGRLGHEVVCAETGLQASKLAMSEEFDLVFMDVQMPEMDGLEATATIRQFEQDTGKHLQIIAMTAHVMKGDRERCLFAGMDDYISKPITPEKVKRLLDHWTSKSRRRAADSTFSAPIIDRAHLNEISGSDSEFAAEIAEEFLQSAPNHLGAIESAYESGDAKAASAAAHGLKGSSFSLGARALAERCEQLESALSEGKLLADDLEALKVSYLVTVSVLRKEILGEAA